jgi:hypothetical protein
MRRLNEQIAAAAEYSRHFFPYCWSILDVVLALLGHRDPIIRDGRVGQSAASSESKLSSADTAISRVPNVQVHHCVISLFPREMWPDVMASLVLLLG